MARVTGIGGVFIRARDPEALGEWYHRHLGVPFENGFATFVWRDDRDAEAQTVWAPMAYDSGHLGSPAQHAMINFRVDDLKALLAELSTAGIEPSGDPVDDETGAFAWIADLEGNRVELWEPRRVG